MTTPFGPLAYLYVGTSDFDRDALWYEERLGAERVWAFARFGARVAAYRVGEGPLVLLADHRPAPSCQPIYAVPNLPAALRVLAARGFTADGEPFEIPNGPCVRFRDPSGNPFAIFQDDRPDAMERSYADPGNAHALRE